MKLLQKLWDLWYFCVLMFLICALLSGCHRKQRLDPIADVPDLPADTVIVTKTKVIDRCNYQYLAADPKKANKQLQAAEKALDDLIAEYDGRLKRKGKIASRKIREIQQLEKDEQF
jgi:hypothetical protein